MYNNNQNNEMIKEKEALGLILLVIGLIVMFGVNSPIGIIFVVLALILSLFNLKYKTNLIKITFFASIVVLGYTIFATKTAYDATNKTLKQIKAKGGATCESEIKLESEKYIKNLRIESPGTTILTENDFIIMKVCNGYEWYAECDNTTYACKAYILGEYYTTDGFDKTNLERN